MHVFLIRRRLRPGRPGRPGRSRRTGAAGFTLIELLLVLLIIGVLAGLVVPRVARRGEEAKVAAARADVRASLPTALELYELDAGRFPTTEQGLGALASEPAVPPFPDKWNGPYVRSGVPTDPWGRPYMYRSPSSRAGADYDVFSVGPDGAEGGGDDVLGWVGDDS